MEMTSSNIQRQFRTAVVPAAGLGTRFLPLTKTVPKELLPVVDTPGIELVAEEAAQAGADRMVLVTAPGKHSVAAHFEEDRDLEDLLARRGKFDLLEKVRNAPKLLDVDTVMQERPLGLGHAVLQAESALAADESAIAVLLPDDLVLPRGVLETMAGVRRRYGGSVLCAIDVPREAVSAYGVFDVAPVTDMDPDVLRVRGMVEKPDAADAPSTLAAAGRYLLDRAVFDALRRIEPGAGGELQLTDAIAALISQGHTVHVVVHRGGRHDIGNPMGFLRASIELALQREQYADSLRDWLRTRLDSPAR
ncbi:UTP--glucose-1-phosphate uridylyltransferase [Nocardia amikacinitolerans]|uniref:UTP--glucose-1-phosphate uridylyltransferase n=1 Tax=Nocardia amikacinitolerans TaxID=756689 RepID=UPI00082ABDFE|nr:UTP--glucose-1-phosphate uridylyltransferase [Nocardia amikacinitolerans]MCP2320172.1 UTP--glucose-1-phosphate uridylyltransferase [Nocardia amikacinitolerans]